MKIMRRNITLTVLFAFFLMGCSNASTGIVEISEPVSSIATSRIDTADLVVINEHPDMSGYQWLNDDNPAITTISLQESVRVFAEGKTAVLYYGRETCPWCQRALPVLNEAAKQEDIIICYIDVGTGFVDNNQEILLDSAEGKKIYNELTSYISSTFTETDEEGNPSFHIPLVIAVRNGSITDSHTSLTEDTTVTTSDMDLSSHEKDELLQIYKQLIQSAL